ncbi:MAG: GyrI-like domain-containing protein [Candidatus Dormibacteraeota bacterium]|nr:GyrI-like domain-containing protein [Candidatus Dormibacteraeota bacterium]
MPRHDTMTRGVQDELGRLYRPPAGRPELVDVPELLFVVVDGEGDPNTAPAFQAAIQSLYAISYGLKFASKHSGGPDWHVNPLEGLWWVEGQGEAEPPPVADGDPAGWMRERSGWRWRAMIRQPDQVTPAMVAQALDAARAKRPLEAAHLVRLERFHEGLSAQVMHIGPYAAEEHTIERLHAFIAEMGLVPAGRHHEIYLGDPRRSAPERLRTVIRQPVRAV